MLDDDVLSVKTKQKNNFTTITSKTMNAKTKTDAIHN